MRKPREICLDAVMAISEEDADQIFRENSESTVESWELVCNLAPSSWVHLLLLS